MTSEKFLTHTQRAQMPATKNTLVFLNYKDSLVKNAIWSLKFKDNTKIAKIFAEIIYDNLIEELADLKLSKNFNSPILIPIPLSKKRLQSRGYNQVELIARELYKRDKDNFFEYRSKILKKIKDTPKQSQMKNKEARIENLEGCFKVTSPNLIQNRNIILLDDIITTGATMNEAVETLRSCGVREVICVGLGH